MVRTTIITAAVLFQFLSTASMSAQDKTEDKYLARATEILSEVPLIDGHNDVPWAFQKRHRNHLAGIDLAGDTRSIEKPMHTDIPRLREGKVGGQFWSVYIPTTIEGAAAVRQVLEQIDLVHRMVARYPDTFEMARTAADIERIHKAGRIASLIGMEGGHSINNSLAVLRQTYAAGARYMTLTHSDHTDWADSSTKPPVHDGLTAFGKEVVREMNRIGMLVDLSHVSEKAMSDVLDVVEAPVIFSHSSARSLGSHPRNVPDSILERVADNGGVVMVTFVPSFLTDRAWRSYAEMKGTETMYEKLHPEDTDAAKAALEAWKMKREERRKNEGAAPLASIDDVADHIDHIRKVAGIDHIGIGSDFDGISTTPDGLDGVEDYPALFAERRRRGYSDDDVKKIAGLNVLRAMRKVESVSSRLSKERLASDVLIDEID